MNRNKLAPFALILATVLVASAVTTFAQTAAKTPAGKTGAKAAATHKPAPHPAAKPVAALPTRDQVDAAMQRTLGYDPALNWNILDIRESIIPGLADVTVSINKQAPQHIYYAAASQTAIIGEMIPFGSNPFAATREKLKASDGPSLGPQTPVIDIVEFSDLECPHCKAAVPIVEKLAKDFPQVRITFQQFPLPATLHPWAMKAALYADCAGHADKAVFWKYIDSVFENQGGIALATSDEKLKELATAAGLDANKLSSCAASMEAEARVKKSLDLGQSLDVQSTPTFFINGRRIQAIANIPYDQLKLLVQFEIDHAGK